MVRAGADRTSSAARARPLVAEARGGRPVLDCRGITKRYQSRTAVDGLTLSVAPGEVVGLLGPNGAGKTTTISIVCGLLDADAGEVFVAGQRMDRRETPVRQCIGYVPQDVALWGRFTARENLRFFGRLYGLFGRELEERIEAVLGLVGLDTRADERVDRYSGGMKRRANIAASILHRPELVVLDEPTVGVDPQSHNALLDLVRGMRDDGAGILLASHNMDEVSRVCDRVVILDEGRILREGTVEYLVTQFGGSAYVELVTTDDVERLAEVSAGVAAVTDVVLTANGVGVTGPGGGELVASLLAEAARCGLRVSSVTTREPDLESVFLRLTGKALRD